MISNVDSATVSAFVSNFFGYGNPRAELWFVGMEEGTGNSWKQHIAPRFDAWRARGMRRFEDLRLYHLAIGANHFFTDRPRIQSTWRRLIQAAMTAHGEDCNDRQTISAYQAQKLGTPRGQTCLLELMPLASPNIRDWPYAHLGRELPHLGSRATYTSAVRPDRIKGLRKLVAKHKPRHVVFYGQTFQQHWAAIAEAHIFEAVRAQPHILRARGAHTTYWALPHPNARGVAGNPYIRLGELIRDQGARLSR